MKLFIGLLFIFLLLFFKSTMAKTLTFAIVPKDAVNEYWLETKKGCQAEAKRLNVNCIYRGPQTTDVRRQDAIIAELIKGGVDGIAIAVSRSDYLARNSVLLAKNSGVPIITFDSDFSESSKKIFKGLRLAYVGSNNFKLGEALGQKLIKLRPQGGKFIIQTGRSDAANLNERILGVRAALTNQTRSKTTHKPLNGENGWYEISAPIPCYGKLDRATNQIKRIFKNQMVDALVAVGGWAQLNDSAYRKMALPFKNILIEGGITVVFADTVKGQLSLLSDKLSHSNIGQSPYEMGKEAIATLHKISQNKPYQETLYTPLTHCTPENVKVCTKQHGEIEGKTHHDL